MYPKPRKADRLKEKEMGRKALMRYRRSQAALAIERDNNQCVFCYFLRRKDTPAADVHHFYGRAKRANDRREHYSSLLCTCRACHPLPVQTVGSSPELEAVLRKANETPINKDFRRSYGTEVQEL